MFNTSAGVIIRFAVSGENVLSIFIGDKEYGKAAPTHFESQPIHVSPHGAARRSVAHIAPLPDLSLELAILDSNTEVTKAPNVEVPSVTKAPIVEVSPVFVPVVTPITAVSIVSVNSGDTQAHHHHHHHHQHHHHVEAAVEVL